jgi:hypothetical protein
MTFEFFLCEISRPAAFASEQLFGVFVYYMFLHLAVLIGDFRLPLHHHPQGGTAFALFHTVIERVRAGSMCASPLYFLAHLLVHKTRGGALWPSTTLMGMQGSQARNWLQWDLGRSD